MSWDVTTVATWLAWSAFTLHLLTFVIYNRNVVRRDARPNVATWLVWSLFTVLNFATYFAMNGDWLKALQPLAGALACTGTLLFAWRNGRLTKMRWLDGVVLLICLAAAMVWIGYKDAVYANLTIQLAFAVSVVPTLYDVVREPTRESPLPWFLWTGAYALLLAVVILRWEGSPSDLVYPINCLLGHGAVGVLASRRRNSRSSPDKGGG